MTQAQRRPTTLDELAAANAKFISEAGFQKALAFKPHPGDIFISPFGKSGTTWLQHIAHGLRTRGSLDFDEITTVTPWIEIAYDMGWDLEAPQVATPRVYKSHLTWEEIPKGGRYICSFRHPHQRVVSTYRFFEGWWFEPGSISLETYVRERYMKNYHNGGYWNHLISWWEQRDNPDVLLLCYEDMQADLPGTVRAVARLMDIPLDDELFEIVVRQSSREFMLAHKEHFDEHVIRAYAETRCGLPPNGDSAKVTEGTPDLAHYQLSPALMDDLDAIWREMIEAKYGFKDYSELRAAIGALVRPTP
jgi:aryl sulfotransferase